MSTTKNHGTKSGHGGALNEVVIPEKFPDLRVVDSMTAKEMNNMTVDERELVYHEVHGVSQAIKEDPDFVSKCLFELQQAINKIRDKPAYDIAYEQSPDFAGGRFIFLMFLRSTNFDVKLAAEKIVKFFEHKRIYFGDELLGRPIQYADLNNEELEILKSGWIQVLPFRDKAGRAVIWFTQAFQPKAKAINVIRAMWYFRNLTMLDEETQKSGAITIACKIQVDLSKENREVVWHISLAENYSPARLMCCHFCVEDQRVVPLVALNRLGWSSATRARSRMHLGSQTEWMYELMTFGIPVDYAPLTNSGNLKTKFYRQWLEQKHNMEKLMIARGQIIPALNNNMYGNTLIIDLPDRNDILMGKGKLQNTYSGNQLLLQVIQENCEEYVNTKCRHGRMDICKRVWRILQSEHARFLERNIDGCTWVEVTNETTIQSKIAYYLRSKKPSNSSLSSSAKKKKHCVSDVNNLLFERAVTDTDQSENSILSKANPSNNNCLTTTSCCPPPSTPSSLQAAGNSNKRVKRS